MTNIIGFDIDGVIIDFNKTFLRTARKKFNILHGITRDDIVDYNYYNCPKLNITKEKCFEIVNYVIENPVECKVEAIKGATEALTNLSKHIDLFFVTARLEKFKQITKETVYSCLPNIDRNKIKILHVSGSKKYKLLKNNKINYFVDDKLTTCRILKEYGINVIMFDSPWNVTQEPFHRTNCWKEISNFIFKEVIKEVSNEKIIY